MLKEIAEAFRRKDLMKELAGRVGDMLEAGHWMFEQAVRVLTREAQWSEVVEPLYERDRTINRAVQGVREAIVTHLTVGNMADFIPCLVLMNVVKDAERIGDLCKNIVEVGKFYKNPYEHHEFWGPLDEIRQAVDKLFEPARRCFLADDPPEAKKVVRESGNLRKQCDLLIQQLLSLHGDFRADEAVAYCLLARHYKRVLAHLSNIATAVVSPVPLLDFPGTKRKDDDAED